ncbi:DNA-binding response OmpR family regulator [Clostridium pascui]|uniref:response regulator transcription factor n=1 Tax=Clostridium pascui TaxID=46609 RepID=UPI00195CA71C|nr:response regulator transcription factor [Clostridium pascui]MBM7869764.1 DNA-binding response OmpR family regulator [Clostridium pascui]
MINILIVEDDKLLNKGISYALGKSTYNVISTFNYDEGLIAFSNNSIDLILLDINLPHKSGLKLCEEIRKNSESPIIFITANDTEQDIIHGFQTGCDDYITKPFSIEILKQRIIAVLKRSSIKEKNIFVYKNITIDYDMMILKKLKEVIKLTTKEYKLVELLAKNKGQVISKQIILGKLWDDHGNFVDENTLSVNIRRLRQKIEDDPRNPKYIITVFGIGYTWGEME